MKVKRRKGKTLIMRDRRLGKVMRRTSGGLSLPGYRQRRNVTRFTGIILAAVVLLFGIWGITSVAADIMRPDVDEESIKQTALDELGDKAGTFGEKDAIDLLVVKVSDDRKTPEYIMLTRFEPSEERVYLTDLMPSTLLGERTYEQWFTQFGAEEAGIRLAELIDCEKVFTVQITYTETRLLINEFGGVTFNLPCSINYVSPNNDRNVNLVKCERVYTGGETARILNYPNWEGGEKEHRDMYCTVLGAVISERFQPEHAERIKDYYQKVFAGTTCDFTRSDYQKKAVGLKYLAESNSGSLVMRVEIEPTVKGDGSTVYEDKQLDLLRAVFGAREEQ